MMTAFAELRSFSFHIDSALILLFSFSAGDCAENIKVNQSSDIQNCNYQNKEHLQYSQKSQFTG